MERRQELTWSHRHTRARGRHPISMRGKWRLTCILDFFNMKTLLQLLLAQKLISSKCVLFKNNLVPSDTAPLIGFPKFQHFSTSFSHNLWKLLMSQVPQCYIMNEKKWSQIQYVKKSFIFYNIYAGKNPTPLYSFYDLKFCPQILLAVQVSTGVTCFGHIADVMRVVKSIQ